MHALFDAFGPFSQVWGIAVFVKKTRSRQHCRKERRL
jgi:hypothetical protein